MNPPPDGPAATPPQFEEAATAPRSRVMECVTAGGVLLLGSGMLIGARNIALRAETEGIDARWWPTVIAAGILAMGLWMLIDAVRGPIEREVQPSQRTGWIQALATLLGIIVILVLWRFGISFLILGPAYLVVLNWIYGLRTWKSLLLFPAIVAAVIYVLFQLLLGVPL